MLKRRWPKVDPFSSNEYLTIPRRISSSISALIGETNPGWKFASQINCSWFTWIFTYRQMLDGILDDLLKRPLNFLVQVNCVHLRNSQQFIFCHFHFKNTRWRSTIIITLKLVMTTDWLRTLEIFKSPVNLFAISVGKTEHRSSNDVETYVITKLIG